MMALSVVPPPNGSLNAPIPDLPPRGYLGYRRSAAGFVVRVAVRARSRQHTHGNRDRPRQTRFVHGRRHHVGRTPRQTVRSDYGTDERAAGGRLSNENPVDRARRHGRQGRRCGRRTRSVQSRVVTAGRHAQPAKGASAVSVGATRYNVDAFKSARRHAVHGARARGTAHRQGTGDLRSAEYPTTGRN